MTKSIRFLSGWVALRMGTLLCMLLSALPAAIEDSADLSPLARAAVDRGLAWIAAQQQPDGSIPGRFGDTPGCAAMQVLVCLATGNTPGRGRHGTVCARALQRLLRQQQPSGLYFVDGMTGGPMYHHALGTLAVAEAWGETADPRLRESLGRAVRLILTSQTARGGWRYQPRPINEDLSVTVMQLMALRAAKDAGTFVPRETIDRGIAYVKSCQNPLVPGVAFGTPAAAGKDGGFGYTGNGGKSGFAMSAAGATSLQVAGDYHDRSVINAIDFILQHRPVGKLEAFPWYYYGHYYAANAIYQSQSLGTYGRNAWQAWYTGVTDELVARQGGNGKWQSPQKGETDHYFALLTLSIPYRYLPVYQR